MRLRRAAAALTLAFAATAPAWADEFDDFRIPEHRALSWTGSLSGSGSRNRGSAGLGASTSSNRNGSLGGMASTGLLWYQDSDPTFTFFNVNAAVQGSRFGSSSESQSATPIPTTSLDESEEHDESVQERWSVSASHRRYPWTVPIGFSLALSAAGNYDQAWGSRDAQSSDRTPTSAVDFTRQRQDETWMYGTNVNATALTGVGRVRDATGVYDAMVLESRLRETGVVTRDLTIAARQRLTDLMYARGDVTSTHDRAAREVWRGIERILRDDGALAEGGLDGYSVFRAAEPHMRAFFGTSPDGVPRSPVQRLRGGLVGIIVRGDHFDERRRAEINQFEQYTFDGVPQPPSSMTVNQRLERSESSALGGVQAEYHRPLGARWQVDARGEVGIPLTEKDVSLATSERASVAFMVAERWLASAYVEHLWRDETRTAGPTAGDFWRWAYAFEIDYYLEDRTTLSLRFTEMQNWHRGDPSGESSDFDAVHRYGSNGQIFAGISYRFAGWFNAPGLSWGPTP